MLIFIAIIFPAIAGISAGLMKKNYKEKIPYYSGIIIISLLLALAAAFYSGDIRLFSFSENADLYFSFDNLGRFYLISVLLLYSSVAFYAFEYMKKEENQEQFFSFFFISLGALIAVAASGNPITLYLSFEMATLTTVPLVLHEKTKDAVTAGLKYLFYSIGGALLGLFGVFFVYFYSSGSRHFTMGGFLDPALISGHEKFFLVVIFVTIIGFGTKAGMYPMHGWLPTAHPIAPAPASSLLSGIIAKAGIVSVVRIVYYSVGADFIRSTWVQTAWMILAMLTVLMGSTMAFLEKNLKRRLAFSTISQISYIMLALSLLSASGLRGALIHLISHAASKGCLFLTAGVFIYLLGKRQVSDLYGLGKKMPLTFTAFLIASLSLVGIPPMGGFLSKWVIALAAADSGMGIFSYLPTIVLLISAFLTAGYLFPVVVDGFFPGKEFEPDKNAAEPPALMTVPMFILCSAALIVGIYGIQIMEGLNF